MRTNESEYKRLEDTIESLKAENAELTKTIQHQDRVLQMYFLSLKEQEEDVHELLKDKRRLDWLLSKGLAWNGCYKGDWLEGEWMYGNSTLNPDARNDIDKAMEESQVQRPKVYTTGILR